MRTGINRKGAQGTFSLMNNDFGDIFKSFKIIYQHYRIVHLQMVTIIHQLFVSINLFKSQHWYHWMWHVFYYNKFKIDYWKTCLSFITCMIQDFDAYSFTLFRFLYLVMEIVYFIVFRWKDALDKCMRSVKLNFRKFFFFCF